MNITIGGKDVHIIDRKIIDKDTQIILAKWIKAGHEEFITWWNKTGTDDVFWGHYFTNLWDAMDDFKERINKW